LIETELIFLTGHVQESKNRAPSKKLNKGNNEMSLFDKLKKTFGGGRLKKEQIERLQQSIHTAIADGEITGQELAYINGFYQDSELTPENFHKIKSEAFINAVNWVIQDRRVTEQEESILIHIAKQLEISPELQQWAKRQIQYFKLFSYIADGGELPIGTPANLILQKSEVCHLSVPVTLLEERVVSRQFTAGSRGVSVRLVKGVSLRFGQMRGQSYSIKDLVPVSNGYFIITNKRLVFSGNTKSISTAFNKLLDLQLWADALQFTSTTRQKPVIVKFDAPEESELSGLIISRLLDEN
jgi:hypothetical protein